ncbi:MAG: hypothetical protein E6G33_02305 [Actinobacteria bacterium]|nr:MAG: hypothetical protein E6G33_02305 [Actinomycetota bacterium]
MDLQQVAPGLWRWTAPHPDWEPSKEVDDPADWDQNVGCIAYAAEDSLVLIDPLVGDGDHEALDELVEAKRDVAILTTIRWHGRSGPELAERYSASATAPAGVEPVEIEGAAETMFWIPEHRALVPGDRLLGDRPPGVRMCPPSWLRYLDGFTQDDLRRELQARLPSLPIEMVLVSHGEPVLHDGRAAVERALAS